MTRETGEAGEASQQRVLRVGIAEVCGDIFVHWRYYLVIWRTRREA